MVPFRSFSRRTLLIIAGVSFVGLLAFGWVMRGVMRPLRPNTIVSLELAFTPGNAAAILRSWGEAGRAAARESLLLDVGLILVGYAPFLASLCLLVARGRTGRSQRLGHWLALGALLAGGLDLVENAALWGVIGQPLDPPGTLTWLAGIAAATKIVLLLAAGGYVLVLGPGLALARVTPLVQWVLSYPLLILLAVLVLAVVWRLALTSLGIPDLFWAEEWYMQALAGAGVGGLLAHLGVMGFLVDTHRASLRDEAFRDQWSAGIAVPWALRWLPSGEARSLLVCYLLRTSLPLLILAVVGALRAPGGVSPWWLPLGAVVSFIAYGFGAVWLTTDPPPPAAGSETTDASPALTLPNHRRLALLLVAMQLAVFATLWFLYRVLEQGVSAALAVCVLLAGIASVFGFLKYFLPGHASGALIAWGVGYVAINSLGGHHLPHLDYYNRVPLDAPRIEPRSAPARTRELESWKAARGGAEKKPPLIVVAVDGGGIRAAVWTSVVMAQLERDVPNFPYYVRVVTGASGGMVGIASYVGSLRPPTESVRHLDLEGKAVELDALVDRVATDSLGTVARELVFKDLILPPFLHRTSDRGLALERAWEQSTRILGQAFSDLAAGEKDGWRPSLIVSPLIVEDGRRLLISNLDVGDLATVPVQTPSLQAIEYFEHIEPRPGRLPLSTAVRLNASFPYVSPAAELPTEPARHTLDAGYYDEHGVELAGTWIWTHRKWLQDNTSGVLLIQVPDALTRLRKHEAQKDRRDWWAAGLLGVTGPVEALLTSGGAAADYRNDQLVRFLSDTLNASQPDFFATAVFEPEATSTAASLPGCGRSRLRRLVGGNDDAFPDVALSWRLTSCEVSRLKEAIRGDEKSQICADRKQFQDWWNAHKLDAEPPLAVKCPPDPVLKLDTLARSDSP